MSHALILDDDEIWRELLMEVVVDERYQPIELARTLEEALAKSNQYRFDLYLCDGDFPDKWKMAARKCNFFNFYSQLLAIDTNPNIVLVSADEKNVARAQSMGLTAYLKNPFDEAGLRARIKLPHD